MCCKHKGRGYLFLLHHVEDALAHRLHSKCGLEHSSQRPPGTRLTRTLPGHAPAPCLGTSPYLLHEEGGQGCGVSCALEPLGVLNRNQLSHEIADIIRLQPCKVTVYISWTELGMQKPGRNWVGTPGHRSWDPTFDRGCDCINEAAL